MLRDDIARYTELSGNDGEHTPIGIIGAFLDGYETGLKDRPKGEWIPVSERLPKERQAVLCWAESTAERLDAEFIGKYDNGVWFLQSDANHLSYPHQYNVVAWQPLPEPYKAESEEV